MTWSLSEFMGLTGWRLFSLIMAALLGGYALATTAGIFIGGVLPVSRGNAALTGNLLSFSVYAAVVIWAFTVRRPLYVWLALITSAGFLAGAGLLLTG